MQLIPAIDLQGGRCVRLVQGDFEQRTDYGDDALAIAAGYRALGLGALHVVDLDGARSGQPRHAALLQRLVRETGLSLQAGGGLRDAQTVARWFDAGMARCVIGSLAVNAPDTVRSWLRRFGPDRLVLALDVRVQDDGTPRLSTAGWTELSRLSLWDCLDAYLDAGLQHVLCTDVARDGTLDGPNLHLYSLVVQRYPQLRLQASGGVRDLADLTALRELRVPAVIVGRALLDGRIADAEVSGFLRGA